MAKSTQADRLLSISTPLGEDYLLINRVRATESLSGLYEINVELLFDEEVDDSFVVTVVDVTKILGRGVAISIRQADGGERMLLGMVNQFTQSGRDRRFSVYHATIVPHVWKLTQSFQSRIFQQKTVPQILAEVFEGFEVKQQLLADYKPRNYCVQYHETDFDFASRLMEEEGIYYYFEHSEGAEKMIIRDSYQSPENCPTKFEVGVYNEQLIGEGVPETAVNGWRTDYKFQSGKVTLWDYNFQLPKKNLEAEKTSVFSVGGNQDFEVYNYSAGYARKFDGIDKSGGEQPSELNNIFTDNAATVKNRMEALDAQHRTIFGTSNCCTLTSGYRFYLKNHPNSDFNIQYIVTSVTQEMEQTPNYDQRENLNAYHNSFTCIPHGSGFPQFRPLPKTRKPIIHGSQTAFVVGPEGEEIFTDKYGRVKVQFNWDREGKNDADSSCWIRVAQAWAGNRWGMMFIPRIGMEVIVEFLEGDPDQPIIKGCVYNPAAMPPYALPDEKTKMTIKSDSSKGGAGFNEIRFEDKKGSEQIFIHGEKDLDVRIKNDRREWTGKDQHLVVKNDRREKIDQDTHLIVGRHQTEEIKGAKHLKVAGDEAIKIGGGLSRDVSGSTATKSGASHTSEAGAGYYIKGMNVVIEAMTGLTIKVGGSFVSINAGGVQISGPMVMINSGGAALSGTPGTLAPPQAPAAADNADDDKPGSKTTLEKRSAARKQKRLNQNAANQNDPSKKAGIKIKMVDEAGKPVAGVRYQITAPDGRVASGSLDKEGKAEVKGLDPGSCKVTFPDLDAEAWSEA